MDTTANHSSISVYLEIGTKRTFAGALDWPGWCRIGMDEASALGNLLGYAPRYTAVLKAAGLSFTTPPDTSRFSVIERLPGNFETNFGSLGTIPAYDSLPLTQNELMHQLAILDACWQAFIAAQAAAAGKQLRMGPRGGGRTLDGISRHVRDGAGSYLKRFGWEFVPIGAGGISEGLLQMQALCREALETASHTALPAIGPRGGIRWKPRYFIRRSAWHLLDHAWEIEDRTS